ncbi:MAG: sugar transferase [Parcubacteria group bacterium]|nr:sugar transferase [Parcubacteria group bacterium]
MKRLFLFLGDVLILYLSLYLTLFLRYGPDFNSQISIHLAPFSLLFIFWIIVFYIAGLYELNLSKNLPDFYSSLFKSIAISATISAIFFYLIPIETFQIAPRRNLLIYIAVFTGLISLWRYLYNRFLEKTFKNNTIIVGFDQISFEFAKFLNRNPQYGYNLKYAFDISEQAAFSFRDIDFRQLRGARDMERILNDERINTIILNPEAYRLPNIIDFFYKASKKGIQFVNLATAYERILKKVPLETVSQLWFLEKVSRAEKRFYEFVKRLTDIILSLIGLAGLIVIFPFIGPAIKITSSGPLFYRQGRVGKGGRIFEVVKFRTMIENAETNGAVWAQREDSRVFKAGRFLRKTRLDELPQVFNILKGEMSVVGPRAERPEFVEKFKKEIPFYEERLLVRPGLTGWAQINYGKDLNESDTKEKLQYDLYYIKNRSLTIDLAVILKTIKTVLSATGW